MGLATDKADLTAMNSQWKVIMSDDLTLTIGQWPSNTDTVLKTVHFQIHLTRDCTSQHAQLQVWRPRAWGNLTWDGPTRSISASSRTTIFCCWGQPRILGQCHNRQCLGAPKWHYLLYVVRQDWLSAVLWFLAIAKPDWANSIWHMHMYNLGHKCWQC